MKDKPDDGMIDPPARGSQEQARADDLERQAAALLERIADLEVSRAKQVHGAFLSEGRRALAEALLSELDAARPDFAQICADLGRSTGISGEEVAAIGAGWSALAGHLRAWLESGAPERPLLNEAWARINALGGTPPREAIQDALAVIESLGGHDPAEKR